MKMYNKYILLVGVLFFTATLQARIFLPAIWGDHMVVQQLSEIHFYGKAEATKPVVIKASWAKAVVKTTSDKTGKWEAVLKTPSAGGPFNISISDGETLVLKDVLVGEVWLCSGQSNMEMPVKGFRGQPVFGSQPYIVGADARRPLRLFTIKNAWSKTPAENVDGNWNLANPQNVSDFSAAGYFFANLLQKTLGIPVGVINCSWSASKIEAWMDQKTLSEFPEVDMSVLKNDDFGYPNGTPTLLFNAMVKPIEGFPVKGVLWYQGEANTDKPELYKKLFPAFVQQWRAFFKSPDLPFYYVQLAPWQSENKDELDWAWFRQTQMELLSQVSNVGMVTTGDAGSEIFIHPPYKIKVGERLAYWALAKTYGVSGIAYSGPLYHSYELKGKIVELDFDYGNDGMTPENEDLQGFEIAGSDGLFHTATARIIESSNHVQVWNDSIEHPTEVRYCFRNYKIGNLCNNMGIPASPFRVVIK